MVGGVLVRPPEGGADQALGGGNVCVCVCLGGVGHRSLPSPYPAPFSSFPQKARAAEQRESQHAMSTEAQVEVHRWFVRSPRSGAAVERAPPCPARSKAMSIHLDAWGVGMKEETAPLTVDFFRHVGPSSLLLSGSRAVGPQGVSSLKSNSSLGFSLFHTHT